MKQINVNLSNQVEVAKQIMKEADEKNEAIVDRIGDTLKLCLETYDRFLAMTRILWNNATSMSQEEFTAWLNDNTDKLDKTVEPLDTILSSWPEFISKNKEEENGNDT